MMRCGSIFLIVERMVACVCLFHNSFMPLPVRQPLTPEPPLEAAQCHCQHRHLCHLKMNSTAFSATSALFEIRSTRPQETRNCSRATVGGFGGTAPILWNHRTLGQGKLKYPTHISKNGWGGLHFIIQMIPNVCDVLNILLLLLNLIFGGMESHETHRIPDFWGCLSKKNRPRPGPFRPAACSME